MCNREYVEKEVLFSVHGPGRRMAELVVEVENVPGSLVKVLNVVAGMGINVLSSFLKAKAFEETAVWSSFIDLTDAGVEVEEVAERLRGLDVVLDVKFSRSVGELVVDELHFPLVLVGERHILMRVDTIGGMFGRLFDIFMSGAVTIIYNMGLEAGVRDARRVREKYGLEGVEALNVVLKERVAKGWGIPVVESLDEERGEAIISVRDLFECLPYRGKLKEPRGHFFRGYLEGAFKTLLEADYKANEVECIARGDPHCKFVVVRRT